VQRRGRKWLVSESNGRSAHTHTHTHARAHTHTHRYIGGEGTSFTATDCSASENSYNVHVYDGATVKLAGCTLDSSTEGYGLYVYSGGAPTSVLASACSISGGCLLHGCG